MMPCVTDFGSNDVTALRCSIESMKWRFFRVFRLSDGMCMTAPCSHLSDMTRVAPCLYREVMYWGELGRSLCSTAMLYLMRRSIAL